MSAGLFLSYAREDEKTARAVATHLEASEEEGILAVWFDRDLAPGEAWEARIGEQLEAASVILVLVSPDFLTPGFAYEVELPLIDSAAARGARVVPVILDTCQWSEDPVLGKWQAFAGGEILKAPGTITFDRQIRRLLDDLLKLVGRSEGDRDWRAEPEVGRADSSGLAYKGSQLQTQLYVNARPLDLARAVGAGLSTLPSGALCSWRSPLKRESYAEHRDGEFLRVLGLASQIPALREFWPARGPHWDALAVVEDPARPSWRGVLLAEGKSYPEEMRSSTRAEGESRRRIAGAIARTQQALGAEIDPEAWLARFYQLGNRLAHLVWLRGCGVEAWLVHLLFVDDPHHATTQAAWRVAMADVYSDMGLSAGHPWVGEAMLPALDRKLLER